MALWKGRAKQALARVAKLEADVLQLQADVAARDERISHLEQANRRLSEQVETLERAGARQAAPFRIPPEKRKTERRRPGRSHGHPGSFRGIPDHVDAEVEVPLSCCPRCGGAVTQVRDLVQYVEEIPQVRPFVTRLTRQVGQCPSCGVIHSQHPLGYSNATGAAGVMLGPRAVALAAALVITHGLTRRRACQVMLMLCGLRITPGGLTHALERMSQLLNHDYDNLGQQLRLADHVHADETSWWVGGPKWWLWVFANSNTTVFRVAQGRGRNIVHETLGPDFAGVLVSDCLASYDNATALQHKCYAHHLKAIHAAEKQLGDKPSPWLQQMRLLLLTAMALKKSKPELEPDDYERMRKQLESNARHHVLEAARASPEEAAVANRLSKQLDHLFTFLYHDNVEATNNLAERQLRPAVIARKLSCGNKTERGARSFEILASMSATCAQRKQSLVELIEHKLNEKATR